VEFQLNLYGNLYLAHDSNNQRISIFIKQSIMDDDVQACLDTPLSHINGGGISFVVPDPDSNSSGTTSFKNYNVSSNRIELHLVCFF